MLHYLPVLVKAMLCQLPKLSRFCIKSHNAAEEGFGQLNYAALEPTNQTRTPSHQKRTRDY
jgi:hypothetical protein